MVNTGGSIAARAKREGGFRRSGEGAESAGGSAGDVRRARSRSSSSSSKSGVVVEAAKGVKVGSTPVTQARVFERKSSGGRGRELSGSERDEALRTTDTSKNQSLETPARVEAIRTQSIRDKTAAVQQSSPIGSFFGQVKKITTPPSGEDFVTARAEKVIERGERLDKFESEFKETPLGKASDFLSVKEDSSVLGTILKAPLQLPKALILDAPVTFQRIPQALDKAALQVQARTVGSSEQKEEARFFKRGDQADAFFTAISPVRPSGRDDEGELRVQKGTKDEKGRNVLLEINKETGEFRTPQQEVGLEFNPVGTANIITAGISAGITASPVLKRSSAPLKNIKGDVKVKVSGTKVSGRSPPVKTTTSLEFQQQSPTASGFFGRGARTKIEVTNLGDITRQTKVGGTVFKQTQKPGAKTSTLQTIKGGRVIRTRVEPALSLEQVTPRVTSTTEGISVSGSSGNLVTNIESGTTFFRVNQPLPLFRTLKGDIKVTGFEKTVTDVNVPSTSVSTSFRGGGTLKVTTPFTPKPSGGSFIPGLSLVETGGQFDLAGGTNFAGRVGDIGTPVTRLQTSSSGGRISSPSPLTELPTTSVSSLKVGAGGGLFGLRSNQNVGSPPAFTGRPSVTPALDFLNRFASKPTEDVISPVRPIESVVPTQEVISEVITDPVVDIGAESRSSSSSGSDVTNIFNVSSPGIGSPVPVGGFLPIVPIFPGGGFGGSRAAKRRKKSKKRATKSVFQSLFGVEGGVVQDGTSEQTGLFLRQ